MKKKIFVVHHHKNFSGAARSMGELILSLKNKIDFYVICPRGSSSSYFKKINKKVIEVTMVPRFNHFAIGHYTGVRWFLILRELYAFLYFFLFLIKLKLKFNKISFFHLNELELIICAPLINLFFDTKITAHLRSRLEKKKGKIRSNVLKKLIKKYLFKIIAIDYDCYETSPLKKITKIIYNGIFHKNLKISKKNNSVLTFGFIGSFIKRKGIFELIKVFKNLDLKNYNVKLICVGNTGKNNFLLNFFHLEKNFNKFLYEENMLSNKNIKILPTTYNLIDFYSKIDVIIFPSYMNAVGRPVIEASWFKKPSIIGLNKYNKDTAVKNTCLIFEPGNLLSLEKKILYLVRNKSKIKKMGKNAFFNAKKNFDIKKNSVKFLKLLEI